MVCIVDELIGFVCFGEQIIAMVVETNAWEVDGRRGFGCAELPVPRFGLLKFKV